MKFEVKSPREHKERKQAEEDDLYQLASDMTPDEAAQWVEDNVTDFSSAKRLLKLMAKILVVMVRHQSR